MKSKSPLLLKLLSSGWFVVVRRICKKQQNQKLVLIK